MQDKSNEDLPKLLSFEDFEIVDLWKIYEKSYEIGKKCAILEQSENSTETTSSLYFNLKIPVLILLYELANCNEIKANIESSASKENSYQNIFNNLCEIIDKCETNADSGLATNQTTGTNKDLEKILKLIAQEILKNGLLLFFPSEKERRECFIYMIEKNTISYNDEASETLIKIENPYLTTSDMSLKRPSTKLLLEAFCNLFCSNKSNLIQHFNKSPNMFDNSNDCKKIISLIDKIIRLYLNINSNITEVEQENSINSITKQNCLIMSLNNLLNSIQSHIFYSIKEQLNKLSENSELNVLDSQIGANLKNFVVSYSKLLIEKCNQIIDLNERGSNLVKSNQTFFTKIIYHFILWLNEIFNKLDLITSTYIFEILIDFHTTLAKLEMIFDGDKSEEIEKTLKTWVFNSKLKSTITDVITDYSYPLANRFVIEFDPNSNLATSENNSE